MKIYQVYTLDGYEITDVALTYSEVIAKKIVDYERQRPFTRGTVDYITVDMHCSFATYKKLADAFDEIMLEE